MYWRRAAADFNRGKGRANRASLRGLVASGQTPGLLAYLDGAPVGWCSVAPRNAFPRLERARKTDCDLPISLAELELDSV